MGNRIGTSFTQLAKKLCDKWFVQLPDPDLAYLPVGTPEFEGYNRALHLAQKFAWENRILMQAQVMRTVRKYAPQVQEEQTVHCHHNYMAWESHGGKNIMITRKGAVRARLGDLGVIPGSMGACSYIVRGLGSDDSFHSCSHGAGRSMSRNQAKKKFTLEDHARATAGVECEKGSGVLDETPEAYKPIDAVMAAQTDLVEPLHKLKQFLCCKGLGE
jgi:tRNA-splicing ligase RtcB